MDPWDFLTRSTEHRQTRTVALITRTLDRKRIHPLPTFNPRDKTHRRFTIQSTENEFKRNTKHLRRNTATPPAIVYYFLLNKRDKTNIIKRRHRTTLRFPKKKLQTFPRAAN